MDNVMVIMFQNFLTQSKVQLSMIILIIPVIPVTLYPVGGLGSLHINL